MSTPAQCDDDCSIISNDALLVIVIIVAYSSEFLKHISLLSPNLGLYSPIMIHRSWFAHLLEKGE